jgi:hypothetical protein
MATRWLGIFGAEVIKVEWPERLDSFRRNVVTVPTGIEPGPNSPGMFADQHVNKRGITLNVRSDKGMDILKRLIAVSDIVIENFSSRVMQSWGLGYEEQKKLNPRSSTSRWPDSARPGRTMPTQQWGHLPRRFPARRSFLAFRASLPQAGDGHIWTTQEACTERYPRSQPSGIGTRRAKASTSICPR